MKKMFGNILEEKEKEKGRLFIALVLFYNGRNCIVKISIPHLAFLKVQSEPDTSENRYLKFP